VGLARQSGEVPEKDQQQIVFDICGQIGWLAMKVDKR